MRRLNLLRCPEKYLSHSLSRERRRFFAFMYGSNVASMCRGDSRCCICGAYQFFKEVGDDGYSFAIEGWCRHWGGRGWRQLDHRVKVPGDVWFHGYFFCSIKCCRIVKQAAKRRMHRWLEQRKLQVARKARWNRRQEMLSRLETVLLNLIGE